DMAPSTYLRTRCGRFATAWNFRTSASRGFALRPHPDMVIWQRGVRVRQRRRRAPFLSLQSWFRPARIEEFRLGAMVAGDLLEVWAVWGGSMSARQNIKVAIAGVGNCASALVQGVEYYRNRQGAALEGVMRPLIGGYRCGDVEFVAAFDIDRRKVGHP